MNQASDKALQARLDLVIERLETLEFLKNDGLGNEIGFWIFDYPPKSELIIRAFLKQLTEKLEKHNYHFKHINIFQSLVELLDSRGLLARSFAREQQIGAEALHQSLKGILSQEKVAKFIAEQAFKSHDNVDFLLLSGCEL